MDSGDGKKTSRNYKRLLAYSSIDNSAKADLLARRRDRRHHQLESNCLTATSTDSSPLTDYDDARVLHNEKRRLAYASMDTTKKNELLAKQRAVYRQKHEGASLSSTKESDVLAKQRSRHWQKRESKSSCSLGLDGAIEVVADVDAVSSAARFNMLRDVYRLPWTLPDAPQCTFCSAFRFHGESAGFCCSSGQVRLAKAVKCDVMWSLFMDTTSELSREFRRRSRSYNNAFALTSLGMQFDKDCWWPKDGIYSLKVHGQVTHFFNAVSGKPNTETMMQLFFIDTAADLGDDMLSKKQFNCDIVNMIASVLSNNPYSKVFKRLRSWDDLHTARVVIRGSCSLDQRNYNLPTVDQVAGVWKDGERDVQGSVRDIQVFTESGHNMNINYYYGAYDSLQYPLLYPLGEPGWDSDVEKVDCRTADNSSMHTDTCTSRVIDAHQAGCGVDAIMHVEEEVLRDKRKRKDMVSCREYYCYKFQIRENDNSYLLHAGRLGQQYVIDMYIKLETSRLDYYRLEQRQKQMRTDSYKGVVDSIYVDGENNPANVGTKVVLPSSFIGGPRDMRIRYVNAMTLVQRFGKPDLFLTMTCNPLWKEITCMLMIGEKADDRPDLVSRVFRAKIDELKDDIVTRKIFGEVAAYVYAIEYKKRGLPHVHWIIILQDYHKLLSPSIYDEFISAELPGNEHPFLRSYVLKHMMHGPCGEDNPKNSCMREGTCKNYYPKEFAEVTSMGKNSYAVYRRRDKKDKVRVRGVLLDNRYVVPYCPFLLAKYDCHINVEVCADIKLVKYLYKYIHKGHDRISYNMVGNTPAKVMDEIQSYQNGRWVSAPEAYWRLYRFPMSGSQPPVIVLPVHLPDHQPLRFGIEQSLEEIIARPQASKTMLTEFFVANATNEDAKRLNLLYKEFPEHFVWKPTLHRWDLRKKQFVVGRLCTINPFEGERYFERVLLLNVRCPTSFEDLMCVNNVKCDTFREAAVSRGFLESDEYMDSCMAEAVLFQMPYSLRTLFAILLVYGIVCDPQRLWDMYYTSMSEDFVRSGLFTESQVLSETINAIEIVLTSMDKSLSDFSIQLPSSSMHVSECLSREYKHEHSINVSDDDIESINLLNAEQRLVFDLVIKRINDAQSGAIFLDGPGGTGKTFLYRAILAYVRRNIGIALAVASSGVAASLLPGGRTAHSRFKLPLDVDDKSNAYISKQSSLAKMIVESKLLIWDEASMANKHSIEALDTSLRDLCDPDVVFGGKVVLFGGDFRQTLPVVVRGSRALTVDASLVSSTLWESITKLKLVNNMRAKDDAPFIDFLLRVGEGREHNVFDDSIRIPSSMLIPFVDTVGSLDSLIQFVYPSFDNFFADSCALINQAILTPKNDSVIDINDVLIDRFPGRVKEYVSFDKTNDSSQQGEYEDYLNTVSASGLPLHILRLKENCPIMLLRNLNPVQGLCNGTRMICRQLGDSFIKAEIAVGDFRGQNVFIPRIHLESTCKSQCPIPFKRMHIPVRLCFAMTINKSQGQTLDIVGIYLCQPVFSHGQLYVALSRAKRSESVKLLVHPNVANNHPFGCTRNIVYHEIFYLSSGCKIPSDDSQKGES